MTQIRSAGYAVKEGLGSVRRSNTMERLTRIGFASKGIVYLLVGILALMAAFGSGGETTDKKGVIQRIMAQPFGEFALVVIGIGLLAYAAWRFLCCFQDLENDGSDAKGIAKRAFYFVSGFVYASAALYAFKLLSGSGPAAGGDSTQSWTARILDAPGGQLLVAAAGIAVIIGGLAQIREGWQERFQKHLRLGQIPGDRKHWAIKVGKWGYVARGIVFSIIGVFVMQAAMRHDASRVRGSEGALDTLAAQPFGQWLLAFVAAGLACYGIYSLIESKYRRVAL
jgi:hypothetical protein